MRRFFLKRDKDERISRVEVETLELALAKEDAIKYYQGMLINYPSMGELLYFLFNEE